MSKLFYVPFAAGLVVSAVSAMSSVQASVAVPYSPWQSYAAIKSTQTSPIYKQQWRKSKYQSCPILALPTRSDAHLKTAKSRAANFSDGFAVAYDLKNYQGKAMRSAYGVANAGKTSLQGLHHWDYEQAYKDGAYITLGREGNDPKGKMLAYIVLENGCFYNVWSQLGESHLHHIISELRYVK